MLFNKYVEVLFTVPAALSTASENPSRRELTSDLPSLLFSWRKS